MPEDKLAHLNELLTNYLEALAGNSAANVPHEQYKQYQLQLFKLLDEKARLQQAGVQFVLDRRTNRYKEVYA